MNKVILMGRLTRDPETRYTEGSNNTCVSRFSLAVERRFKREGEPDADFFNCTSFGRQGEFVEKYLRQGTKVVVVGRLQQDNYTNRNGEKVYSIQVIVEEVEFAESKTASQNSNEKPMAKPATASSDGFMSIPEGIEEDLPFR